MTTNSVLPKFHFVAAAQLQGRKPETDDYLCGSSALLKDSLNMQQL